MKKIAIVTALAVIVCLRAGFAEEAAPQADEAQSKIAPKKVEVDSNYDGKIDRTEIYDTDGRIMRVESDTNADGKIDDWITYESGKPVQEQRDSNADGKPDVWIEY